MIAHSTWGLLAVITLLVAFVVFARALEPLIKAGGLVLGLIGTVVAAIAAALALCAVIFAGVASWAGWTQPSAPLYASGHPEAHRAAMVALGMAIGAVVVVLAFFAGGLWRKKRG